MGSAVVVADMDVNAVLPVDVVQGQVVTRLLQVVVQEWHHVMKALIRARHHERVCHAPPPYATHHKRSDWCLLFSSMIRMFHFYTKGRLIYENNKRRQQPLESRLFFCFRWRWVRSFIQTAALFLLIFLLVIHTRAYCAPPGKYLKLSTFYV